MITLSPQFSRFEKYTEYALNVPMLMVYRNGNWNDVAGASFKVA
jgi:gamma-glutamylcysteine synthetase